MAEYIRPELELRLDSYGPDCSLAYVCGIPAAQIRHCFLVQGSGAGLICMIVLLTTESFPGAATAPDSWGIWRCSDQQSGREGDLQLSSHSALKEGTGLKF